jgi:Putative Zn-dependent protease, contains TPR repeats
MLFERIFFNIVAVTLFIYMLRKLIKKGDNTYIIVMAFQIMSITVNFLEVINGIFIDNKLKIVTFIFSIVFPVIVVSLEIFKISLAEIFALGFGKIFVLTKNYKIVNKICDRVIKIYPESYHVHKMLAELYELEGGMRKAIDQYVKVVDIRKQDYKSYFKIALLLEDLDKKEEAVTILNNLLRTKPDYMPASDLLGILLCEQNKFKDAIKVYTEAIKFNPESYELYYNLGIAYTKLNDFQNAMLYYKQAAELNSLLHNAYYSMGQISLIYHDIENAEMYFTKSLYGKETEAKSYYQLAKIYMSRNDRAKAMSSIEQAIRIDDTYKEKAYLDPIFESIKDYIISINAGKQNSKKDIELEKEINIDNNDDIELSTISKNTNLTTRDKMKVSNENIVNSIEKNFEVDDYLDKTYGIIKEIKESRKEKEEKKLSNQVNKSGVFSSKNILEQIYMQREAEREGNRKGEKTHE